MSKDGRVGHLQSINTWKRNSGKSRRPAAWGAQAGGKRAVRGVVLRTTDRTRRQQKFKQQSSRSGRQEVCADANRQIRGSQDRQDSGELIAKVESLSEHVCCLRSDSGAGFSERSTPACSLVNNRSVNNRSVNKRSVNISIIRAHHSRCQGGICQQSSEHRT
jgi:hypothetical protein